MSYRADVIIKTALIGDYAVGKTSLFQRYIYNKLSYQPTIGVDFMPKDERVGELNVTLHLWDTAGQERFRSIVQTYFRNIYLFILVFDVSRKISFDALTEWLKTISEGNQNKYRVLLVANKADKPDTEWQVSHTDVNTFARKYNIDTCDVYYVSAEATDDPSITRMFRSTLTSIVEDIDYIQPFGGFIDRRQVRKSIGDTHRLHSMSTQLQRLGLFSFSSERYNSDSDGIRTPPSESEENEDNMHRNIYVRQNSDYPNSDNKSYKCCALG